MPFGIGIGQVIGLVRETRGLEGLRAPITLSGSGAVELAAALAVGGDEQSQQVPPVSAPVPTQRAVAVRTDHQAVVAGHVDCHVAADVHVP